VLTQQPKGQLQNKHEQRLNYKKNTYKQAEANQTKPNQGTLDNNKSSKSSITTTVMWRDKIIYIYIHINIANIRIICVGFELLTAVAMRVPSSGR
jgi:hypothetical protein